MKPTCEYAACGRASVNELDGYSFCRKHVREHRADMHAEGCPPRDRDSRAVLCDVIRQLHDVGLHDGHIAAALKVSKFTARYHRRNLGLTANRHPRQAARDDNLAVAADARISRCSACDAWQWDRQCRRCQQRHEVAS